MGSDKHNSATTAGLGFLIHDHGRLEALVTEISVTGVAGLEPATYGFGDRRSTN